MGNIALEVPLSFLALGRRAQGDDLADAGVEGFCDALDGAAFAGCIPAFKDHDDAQVFMANPLLELDQLDLQATVLLFVVAVFAKVLYIGVDWRQRRLGMILAVRGGSLRVLALALFLALACHVTSSKSAGGPLHMHVKRKLPARAQYCRPSFSPFARF